MIETVDIDPLLLLEKLLLILLSFVKPDIVVFKTFILF